MRLAGASANAGADAAEGLDTSWKSRRQGVQVASARIQFAGGERTQKETGPGKEPMA